MVELPDPRSLASPRFVSTLPAYRAISVAINPVSVAVTETMGAISSGAQGLDRGWAYKSLIEHAFEVVRLTIDPFLPSRLVSLFAFTDLDPAIEFASEQQHGVVYELDFDAATSHAVADMDLYPQSPASLDVNVQAFAAQWAIAIASAHRYWTRQTPVGTAEVLIDGPVRVVGIPWRADAGDGQK
jgi:hypothetical protein